MKKAFTIMEVLVTIAIVGIIGATIMGNIISTKPDPKVMAFRSSYYGLQQAVTEAVNNKYFYDQADMNNRIYNIAAVTETGNMMLAKTSGLSGGKATGFVAKHRVGDGRSEFLCRTIASYLNLQQFTWNGDANRFNHCDLADAQDIEADSNIITLGAADNTQNFILFNGAKVYGLRSRHKTVNDDTGQPKNCPIPVIIDVNGNDGPNLLYNPNGGVGYTTDVNNVDRFRVKISPAGKVYIGYDADEENIRDIAPAQDCNLFGARSTTLPELFRPERAILSDPSKNKTTAE